jgi:hypothetical protein
VTKVRFATQQLRGPARTWWDHFLAMQPARAIEVHSPTCGETTLYLPDQGCTRSYAFTMIESPVERIPVVCDYPDVFLDELPGMPPDRDIEFAVEFSLGLLLYPRDPIGCLQQN